MEAPRSSLVKWVEAQVNRPARWRRLAGDGSDKSFWRLDLGIKSLVAVDGSGLDEARRTENKAFLLIGKHLAARGVPVPRIVAAEPGSGFFLIEDLGDVRLADRAAQAKGDELERIYQRVIDTLVEMQKRAVRGFDPAWCAQTARYDRAMILSYETYYFMRAFAQEYCGAGEEPPGLRAELTGLADRAAQAGPELFLHRDFQSRNIMLQGDRIRIVDYQGGRLGPPGYDLASLLLDPYVGLGPKIRDGLLEYYLEQALEPLGLDRERFRQDHHYLALHRLMQMLGAFAFLTRKKHRSGFAEHIPPALARLRELAREPEFDGFPLFRSYLDSLPQERADCGE